MKHITSPYNFAPIASKVYAPEWADRVSHDIPFSDGEDGVIDVTLENVSPLFTRNGSVTKDETFSSHINTPEGKLYFIPGSTLKGMLRNLVSIMSFGKMQEGRDYKNRSFGWRDVSRQLGREKANEYQAAIARSKPGWLRKEKNDNYSFTPCVGEYGKLQMVWIALKYPSYATAKSMYEANEALGWFPDYEQDGLRYKVVCTGKMDGKKHELLYPAETGMPIDVKKETIAAFLSVYEHTPDFMPAKKGDPCWKSMLDDGQPIPVFRTVLKDGREVIGMGRMFKLPYAHDVKDMVAAQQDETAQKDLAETLFGTIQGQALKGRVHVGHAFMPRTLQDSELLPLRTENLGSPRASFFPLYLQQSREHGSYQNYDDAKGIAGRKLYRIHKNGNTSTLPKNENENVGTSFRPLPSLQTFHLQIAVHNVRKMELGALLAALTLNGTDGLFHNLGMAKSLGYGKVKVTEVKLDQRFRYAVKDYIQEYEAEMTLFAKKPWRDTPAVRALASILSEHQDEVVETMELKEFAAAKGTQLGANSDKERYGFTLLSEQEDATRQLNSYLSKEDIVHRELSADIAEAEASTNVHIPQLDHTAPQQFVQEAEVAKEQLEHALQLYNSLVHTLTMSDVACEAEKQQVEKLKLQIDDINKGIAEATDLVQKAKAQQEQDSGLQADLDKEAGNGGYSVSTFKILFSRVDRWAKRYHDGKVSELTADEQQAVVETARRLLASLKKDEAKDLKKPREKSSIWRKLPQYLPAGEVDDLYDSWRKQQK